MFEEVVWISLDTSHGASPILSFSRIVSVSICKCVCIYGQIVFIIQYLSYIVFITHRHRHTDTDKHTHTNTHTHKYIYIYIYIYTYIYIYIYIYIYKSVHTYIITQKRCRRGNM